MRRFGAPPSIVFPTALPRRRLTRRGSDLGDPNNTHITAPPSLSPATQATATPAARKHHLSGSCRAPRRPIHSTLNISDLFKSSPIPTLNSQLVAGSQGWRSDDQTCDGQGDLHRGGSPLRFRLHRNIEYSHIHTGHRAWASASASAPQATFSHGGRTLCLSVQLDPARARRETRETAAAVSSRSCPPRRSRTHPEPRRLFSATLGGRG